MVCLTSKQARILKLILCLEITGARPNTCAIYSKGLVVNQIVVYPGLVPSEYSVCFEYNYGRETLPGVNTTKYKHKIHKAINLILIIFHSLCETFSPGRCELQCTPPYQCPLAYTQKCHLQYLVLMPFCNMERGGRHHCL